MQNKRLLALIAILGLVLAVSACEDKRVPQLQADLNKTREELSKTKDELKVTQDEFTLTRQQLETATKEMAQHQQQAQEKEKSAQAEIETLKMKLELHIDDLSRDTLLVPNYLIDKTVVIYTKAPKGSAEEVQIFIGIVKDIIHKDKVILHIKAEDRLVEVPYGDITGFRLTK